MFPSLSIDESTDASFTRLASEMAVQDPIPFERNNCTVWIEELMLSRFLAKENISFSGTTCQFSALFRSVMNSGPISSGMSNDKYVSPAAMTCE